MRWVEASEDEFPEVKALLETWYEVLSEMPNKFDKIVRSKVRP